MSVCYCFDYGILVFLAFEGRECVESGLQILLSGYVLSSWVYSIRGTYTLHPGHPPTDILGASSDRQIILTLLGPSIQRLRQMLYLLRAMFLGLLRTLHPLHLPQRLHNDGNHGFRILLSRSLSILPDLTLKCRIRNLPRCRTSPHVLRQTAHHLDLYLCRIYHDHQDRSFFIRAVRARYADYSNFFVLF